MGVLWPEDAEIALDRSSPEDNGLDIPKSQPRLAEEPKTSRPVKLGAVDSFWALLVPVSPLATAIVAVVPVVRAADALVELFHANIYGRDKGFTAHVCVLNSSSPFLLFVSGSR